MYPRFTRLAAFCGLLSFVSSLTAQCLVPELAMIEACVSHAQPGSGPDVEGEFIIARTQLIAVPVDELGIRFQGGGSGLNGDIGTDPRTPGQPFECSFARPEITGLTGCPNTVALGPGQTIPPNARVVIFLNGATDTDSYEGIDFSQVCAGNEPIYLIQNGCVRTEPPFELSTGFDLNTTVVFSPCGARQFQPRVARASDFVEGVYWLTGQGKTGNLDCEVPILPDPCPMLDTALTLCGLGGQTIDFSRFDPIFPDSVQRPTLRYHRTPEDAEQNTNRLDDYTVPGTETTDTLYVNVVYSADVFCSAVGRIVVRTRNDAVTSLTPDEPLRGCDEFGLGRFDLRQFDNRVGGNAPVTWFEDPAGSVEIDFPGEYLTNAATVYARAGLGECAGDFVPVQLVKFAPPVINDVRAYPTSCEDNADGSVRLDQDLTEDYRVFWSDGRSSAVDTLDGFAAGLYTAVLVDSNGCEASQTFNINPGKGAALNCSLVRPLSAMGAADAAVSVALTAGAGPFSVVIRRDGIGYRGATLSANDTTFTDLPEGSYSLEATDANGCVAEACGFVVEVPPSLTLVCAVINGTSGSITGNASIDIEGGVGPFDLTINGPNGFARIDAGLPGGEQAVRLAPRSGTYQLEVRDAAGQTASCSLDIPTEPCPLTVDYLLRTTDCSTGASTIILQIFGNDGNVTTEWSGGSNIENNDGQQEAQVSPGTYAVTVSDEANCSVEVTNIETSTLPITFDADFRPYTGSCDDKAIIRVLNPSGGRPPYTLEAGIEGDSFGIFANDVNPGALTLIEVPFPTAETRYEVVITDGFGCSSQASAFVTLPAPPADPNIVLDEVPVAMTGCEEGQGSIFVSADSDVSDASYSFTWIDYPGIGQRPAPPGVAEISGQPSGEYTVRVTIDGQDCSEDFDVLLPAPNTPVLDCGDPVAATDSTGGQIPIVITGGVPPFQLRLGGLDTVYVLTDVTSRDFTIDNLVSDEYVLELTDAAGCVAPNTCGVISVRSATCPTLAVSAPDTLCNLGSNPLNFSATLQGQGDISYAYSVFNDGDFLDSFVVTGVSNTHSTTIPAGVLAEGPNEVRFTRVTDATCTIDPNISLFIFGAVPDTVVETGTYCQGEAPVFFGRVFTAANPSAIFTVFDAGNPCGTTVKVDLIFNTIATTVDTLELEQCPGAPYLAEDGTVFDANRLEGLVRIPRVSQCDSFYYLRLSLYEPAIGPEITDRVCAGDTVRVGNGVFTVDNPNGIVVLDEPSSRGCDSLAVVIVNFTQVGEIRLFGDRTICQGDSTELRLEYDAGGGVNIVLEDNFGQRYELSGGDDATLLVRPTVSTTYRAVSAVTGDGCVGEAQGLATVLVSDISLDIALDSSTIACEFAPVTLDANLATTADGFSGSWNTGETTTRIEVFRDSTYRFAVTDDNGCTAEDSLDFEFPQRLRATLSAAPPVCPGERGSVVVDTVYGGAGNYELSLDGTFFTAVSPGSRVRALPGDYRLMLQDANDCTVDQMIIQVPEALEGGLFANQDTSIMLGDSVAIEPRLAAGIASVTWSPPATLSDPTALNTVARPLRTTDYTLEVVTTDDCTITEKYTIIVDSRLPIFLPNIFSPNGDDVNDVFRPGVAARGPDFSLLRVYDRWGALVYEGEEIAWDGTKDTEPVPVGVYVYQLTVNFPDGRTEIVRGDVTVMR